MRQEMFEIIECCLRLHDKAIDARIPMNAGNRLEQPYQNNFVYQGVDNNGIAVRQRVVQRF